MLLQGNKNRFMLYCVYEICMELNDNNSNNNNSNNNSNNINGLLSELPQKWLFD